MTNEEKQLTREEKIKSLKSGQKEIGGSINYDQFGDLSSVSDERLDKLIEELDWTCK